MLEVESGVPAAKIERNITLKAEIKETLEKMEKGQSFAIEGKIKKSMVKLVAVAANVKIKISKAADGKIRCWKE